MAFTFSLTLDWLKHRLLALKRVSKGLPTHYFIDSYKQSAINVKKGHNLSALPSLCQICGFSIAEMELASGWSIRACSATGFEQIFANPDFRSWQQDIFDSDQHNRQYGAQHRDQHDGQHNNQHDGQHSGKHSDQAVVSNDR